MTRQAKSCCGKCTLEMHGGPAIDAICDCRNCKRRTGSAFGSATVSNEGRCAWVGLPAHGRISL